ncbi:hypothetical protein H0H87_008248 [Tephrocybe sp. NHM501043]|nr:hypothetical protein H0H87_008248 [Tephrocybe sp. NHM501043]
MPQSTTLAMSHILANDALLSPVLDAAPWDALYAPANDAFAHYYAPPSPSSSASDSPTPATRMLKMRMSPDTDADQQQLCLPTHQVFDIPEQSVPTGTSGQDSEKQERLSISINPAVVAASVAAKRSASPAPSLSKKPRAAGERINSKDFIPPDVSGLSKREARLVKNRAAAFLSRQRKREEFELMEVRVAELEQENARLLALTQTESSASQSSSNSDNELLSQIQDLKAQLAAAKERERNLSVELAKSKAATVIKVEETTDPQLPLSPVRSSANKSGASLGLMVLLCALPTLLSMPMNSALPKSFAIPNAPLPSAPAAFDFNSFVPNDYDWTRSTANNMMDLDDLDMSAILPSAPASQKLEFSSSGVSTDADNALAGLDISFDTVPADNGKIRVRIHPPSTVSSRAASPGASSFSDSKSEISSPWNTESELTADAAFIPSSLSSTSSLVSSPSASSPSAYLSPPSPGGDPFLGVGAGSDYSYSSEMSEMFGMDDALSGASELGQDVGYGSEYSGGDNAKRRVRIALKSMPSAGGEGGEWEVQIC